MLNVNPNATSLEWLNCQNESGNCSVGLVVC